jgi:hypothetical protein
MYMLLLQSLNIRTARALLVCMHAAVSVGHMFVQGSAQVQVKA